MDNNWWRRYPDLARGHWHYWHGRYPWNYWWRYPTWAGVTGWIIGSWGQPVYYDYGSNVVYQDNSVYVDGQDVGTQQQYAQQAADLADVPPPSSEQAADAVEWMPLGTFAVASSEDEKDPSILLQLAVSKEGVISGTYYNTGTDKALPVQGGVDRETQRAAWTIGDNKNTVMETGIYNLTEDFTPVLVHFGTDKTQTWYLARLDDPQADDAAASQAGESQLP